MGGFATPNGSFFFFFFNFCTLVVMLSGKETQGRRVSQSLTSFHICKYMVSSTASTDVVWWWEGSLSTEKQRLRYGGRRGKGVCVRVCVCVGGGVAG